MDSDTANIIIVLASVGIAATFGVMARSYKRQRDEAREYGENTLNTLRRESETRKETLNTILKQQSLNDAMINRMCGRIASALSCVTPNANGTVRKMARILRGEE